MKTVKNITSRITKDLKTAWILLIILSGCSLNETAIAQSSTILSKHEHYVTALEDSLILLQEIRPAYRNLQIAHKLQKDAGELAQKEWMFERSAKDMQINQLTDDNKVLRQNNRTAYKKGVWQGTGIGALAALAIKLLTML